MKLRHLPVIAGILLLYSAISAYIGWNGWLLLSTASNWTNPAAYTVIFAFLVFAYLLGRLGQSTAARPLAEPVKFIGAYWFAALEYGLLILPVADLAGLILYGSGVGKESAVLIPGTLAAIAMLCLLALGSRNAWSPIIRRFDVKLDKPSLEGKPFKPLRIAMASDIHLGTVVGKRHLRRLVDRVNQIKPDIILLPGDILDDDLAPFLHKNMAEELGKLSAPLGVYAVTGNHEYIGGKVPEFVEELSRIGIKVLMDESVEIDNRFIVIGRKDKAAEGRRSTGRKSIAELIEPLDRSMPLIMLDHQPSDLIAASENGIDLSLSGHTHRGQMMPNHLITRRVFPLDFGYRKFGQLHAIVSSGFGFWGPPIRIGSRSEVIHIEVRG
ncbi:metallophosphoesterase [Paenibacillus sp. HB172176]|uniref:metallophosphoesterase n=1 Tax=Paenibacillus sp. HB172176 TaxID=2493690 RepID=UPI00143A6D4B|nr:metallophosphoesterase [Paenibacillus sp. HB172176]